MEDVAGETLRMHAHEHALAPLHVTEHEGDMLVRIDIVAVADDSPDTGIGRQSRLGSAVHQALVLKTVPDELRDGDHRQSVLLREDLELWALRRGAVVGEDLADDARRVQAGESREVDGRLGVTDPLQHAAFASAQW